MTPPRDAGTSSSAAAGASAEAAAAERASDLELFARIARGDRAAFDALFTETYGALVGFAESLVRSRDVAEDIVQDVMLNLWRQRESVRIQDSLRAYLYRATRNRALNQLRHERVRRDAAPEIVRETRPSAAGDAQMITAEMEVAIREAVAELPPRCREIFRLSREDGLRYAEIAQVLGISIKTVETQMGRALHSLRERLAPLLT